MAWHETILNWLIHAAVGGTLFLLAGWLALLFCRQPVRRIRVIELALVGSLLAPWLVFFPGVPRWSLGWVAFGATTPSTMADQPIVEQPPAFGGPERSPPPFAPRTADDNTVRALQEVPPEIATAPLADAPSTTPSLAPAPRPFSWAGFVIVVYLGVTALLALRMLLGLAYVGWLRFSAANAPPHVMNLFRQIAGPAGRRVRVLVSESVPLPLAFMGWRPIILLPAATCRNNDLVQVRYGLAHEWSHVQRGDIWRWYLANLAQLLYFYHPLLWLLRRELRLCQDYLADARAAGQAHENEDYAEYLVTLARQRLGVPVAALGISDRRSNLYRRIIMLLKRPALLEERCLKSWSLAAALAAFALLAMCSAVRLDAAPNEEPQPTAKAAKETKEKPAAKAETKGETLRYSGKVTDKDTGKGIAGAIVTVRRSLYGDPEIKTEDDRVMEESKHKTDAEGKYEFVIPPEQSSKRYLYIELDVEHAEYAAKKGFGYALSMIRKNEKLGGRPFFEHVELRPGKAVTGIVETPDGKPAVGVKVQAYSRTTKVGENEFEYGSFDSAKTDEKGAFRLVMTTPGEAILWFLPQDYAPMARKLKDDQRGDLGKFRLRDGIVVRGKVLDAKGKPLAGISVNVDREGVPEDERVNMVADSIGRAALTDANGEFTLKPLPAGDYRIFPSEHHSDPASFKRDRTKRPIPAVFVRRKLVLKEDETPEPLEVRAVPHVVIEAQHYDGKGKKSRGHEFHIFGRIDGGYFFGEGKQDPDGKVTAMVPHGLEQTQLNLMTNEHGVLRWRLAKDKPLENKRRIDLGTVNDDVKGIEIIRYTAPILLINAVDKDKKQIKGFKAQVAYISGKSPKDPNSFFVNGVKGDVYLEKQEDGRWRTSQMLPEEEIEVTAQADGYDAKSIMLKMPEGETKELELVLDKSSAKTPKKNVDNQPEKKEKQPAKK